MAFEIKDAVATVPVIRTPRAVIWDRVHEANGLWVPVEMPSKDQAASLGNNTKARNGRKDIHGGRYEYRQRENVVYIRFVKDEQAPDQKK